MAEKKEIRAFLLHMGYNMWCEWLPQELMKDEFIGEKNRPYRRLPCDWNIWRETTAKLAAKGMNMVVIDLGEALAYPSHPELAVEGSLTPEQMREEVRRLRKMGLEPIPKLNFSTTHDGWLKDYHRMVSTPEYYKVVKDVIRDAWVAFERPRFIHLGFDEERPEWQRQLNFFVARQGELWWHDFLYTVKCVEDLGARAWVWSDMGPHKPEYVERCPKSVVQSPWYYDAYNAKLSMDRKANPHWWKLQNILDLEANGFDQIPCGTNWIGFKRKALGLNGDEVMSLVVKFTREHAVSEHMLGFLMAPWSSCKDAQANARNISGADLFAAALGL